MGEMFVLRHGESDHNIPDPEHGELFAGGRIDTQLTQRGEKDAEAMAEKLNELAECTVIYCSKLIRSRRTAEIISRKIKELSGNEIPVVELPGIEEVDGGDFSGLRKQEIRRLFPDEAQHFWETVVKTNEIRQINFPGGENYEQVTARLTPAVAQIREQLAQDKHVAIVTHANTIKVLLDWLKTDPLTHIEDHPVTVQEADAETGERGIKSYTIHVVSWEHV